MLSQLDYPVHVVHCLCMHLLTHLETVLIQAHVASHPEVEELLVVPDGGIESAWTCVNVHACVGCCFTMAVC